MNEPTVKLIAMDFDFTLIDYQPDTPCRIEAPTLRCLNELASAGVHVGIVTGRGFDGFRETLLSVGGTWGEGFPNYLICADSYLYEADGNGGYAPDEAGNQQTRERIEKQVRKFLSILPECLEKIDAAGIAIKGWSVGSAHGATLETEGPQCAQRALDLVAGLYPDVQFSRNHHLFHMTPPGEGKGASVLRYAKRLGIRPDQVLCIGDSLNDLTMLDGRYGFRSGTVDNGDVRVKDAVKKNGGFVSARRASLGVLDCIQSMLKPQ